MHKSTLKSLALMGGIHTVSIKSSYIPINTHLNHSGCVSVPYRCSLPSGEGEYRTKINPNKYKGTINSLEDFERAMASIQDELGMGSYKLTRVDFSLDSFEIDSFEKYLKINRMAVMILAMQHKPKSKYKSTDLFTDEVLTLRMDSEYIQVEYYNKNIESNGSSPVQARLELRSKRFTKRNRSVLKEIDLWIGRLRDIPKGSKILQDTCNEILVNKWRIESAAGVVRSKAEFIRNNKEKIFTDKQLIDLCLLLGTTEKYAREVKYKAKVDTYTEAELEEFIEIAVEALANFTATCRK